MEKRTLIALVIITLFCSSMILIGIINQSNGNESLDNYEFEWAVEVGDTFNFQIIVTGGTFSSSSESGPPPHIEYNESVICAEVIYLPMNTTSIDNATLLSEIILPVKFSCTFANSSSIPEPIHSKLIRLLSWTTVPLDNWELLNSSYYTNKFLNPLDYVNQTICSTKMDDSSLDLTLRIQDNWMHPGMAEIWNGVINMTTGLPYLLTYKDVSFSCSGDGYSVTLTLHRIE